MQTFSCSAANSAVAQARRSVCKGRLGWPISGTACTLSVIQLRRCGACLQTVEKELTSPLCHRAGTSNGYMEAYLDGELVASKTGLELAADEEQVVDRLMCDTLYGGSANDAARKDEVPPSR